MTLIDFDKLMHYDLDNRALSFNHVSFDFALLALTAITTLRNTMREKI